MCLLGVIPAYADSTTLSTRTHDLEIQMTKMQNELHAIKKEQKQHTHPTQPKHINHNTKTFTQVLPAVKDTGADAASTNEPINYIEGPQNLPTGGLHYIGTDADAPGQSFVSTGPYINSHISYSGMNLIINSPNINEDVSLLNVRKNIRERLRALHVPVDEGHSHLLLSGIIESQASYRHIGGGPSSSDIDLTSAGLDSFILSSSHWVTGLMSFAYDNDRGTDTGSFNNNSRVQNSRLFVNKAFVVLGDFEVSPLYSTFGQMYVPFGTYSSSMVSSPLTKTVARIKGRAILVGLQEPGDDSFYGSAFIMRGDTHAGSASRVNNGGLNAGYRFVKGKFSGNFGASYILNMADAQGMQNTGNGPTYFGGFGGVNGSGNERIIHRVPGANVRGLFSIGTSIDLLAEYVGAATAFNGSDMTYNSHGARPKAIHTEAAYTFAVLNRPTSVAVGYDHTRDALAIGVPLSRMSMTLNTSIWRETLQSLEFRHDINYAASSYASGSTIQAYPPSGKSDNIVTAQFDMYF